MKVTVDATQLDNLTKFFSEMPGRNERARNSAMSTIGFNLKNAAKKAIAGNEYNWPELSKLTLLTKANPAAPVGSRTPGYRIDPVITLAGKAVMRTWGMLANLLVYTIDKASGGLLFGFEAGTYGKRLAYQTAALGPDGKPVNGSWGANQASASNPQGVKVFVPNVISEKAITLAKKLTIGFENRVQSNAQQRYFAAFGYIFRIGTTLKTPPRPIVGPTFDRQRGKIPTWFADKFWERLRKYCG